MNAYWELIIVMKTQLVATLTEVIHVCVKVDIVETELFATVFDKTLVTSKVNKCLVILKKA